MRHIALSNLSRGSKEPPEALAEVLLRERLVEREVLARQNAEWQVNLDDALARAARGENVHYDSTDAFFAVLDEIPTEGSSE